MLTGYNPPKKRRTKYFGSGKQQQDKPRKRTPWDDSELSDVEDDQEEEKIEEKETSQSDASAPPVRNNDLPLEEKLKRVNESDIDYEMLGHLVKCLIRDKAMGSDGSILVFLPGAPEINQAKNIIGKLTERMPVLVLPLHGGLQPREQNLVFRSSPNAVKVILSTNVAETSITIPDCTVVIDGCREKQSSYDPVNRMPLLIEVFASQASIKQRRGRAGRVREGKCYKLISRDTHAKLHQHSAPEITRCALDQTLLSLLFLGVETGNGTFLRTLLDPPKAQAVDAAVHSLWKIGALEKSGPEALVLTPLGMHLAGIPAPPMIGKSKLVCASHSLRNVFDYLIPLSSFSQCLSWVQSWVVVGLLWPWRLASVPVSRLFFEWTNPESVQTVKNRFSNRRTGQFLRREPSSLSRLETVTMPCWRQPS